MRHRLRYGPWITAVAMLLLLAVACSSAGPTNENSATTATSTTTATSEVSPSTSEQVATNVDDLVWPEDRWPQATPTQAGISQVELDNLAAKAEAAGSSCLAVTRDGQLVADWYWQDTTVHSEAESFSITKSVTATLVGIAADDGDLDIEQPASDFIAEWRDTPSEAVTIRNLLSNDSGRFQDTVTDYISMAARAEDKTAFSIELDQQDDPGTAWVYNNAAIQTLEAVLAGATGMPVDEFAQERLFEPLGMKSHLTTDTAGNTMTFMGMQSTCQDLARFGLLYLRGGEWAGQQIVSESFVNEAVSPSTELNRGYGLLWWLIGETEGDTAAGQSDLSPVDIQGYAAIGAGDQILAVFPETNIVVARLGLGTGQFGVSDISHWVAGLDRN